MAWEPGAEPPLTLVGELVALGPAHKGILPPDPDADGSAGRAD